MALRHGAQFLGGAVADRMKVKVKWHGVSEKAVAEYIQKAIEQDDSASSTATRNDGDQPGKENASCSVTESSVCDNDDNDNNEYFEYDSEFREKILEVTKENRMKGDASKNEFIWFDQGDTDELSSVPVVINHVIVFKYLQSELDYGFEDLRELDTSPLYDSECFFPQIFLMPKSYS
eukprot:Seg2420.1 transcript_id=Seg2420.1/GoldUCD/mRNA.D3Y31 product="hypothetical protein" protein_id=Seg2420.1/GoldUCD/D3Y31